MFSDDWHSIKPGQDFTFFPPAPQRVDIDMDKPNERRTMFSSGNVAGMDGIVGNNGFRMRGGFPLFIGATETPVATVVTLYMSSGAYKVGNYNLSQMELTEPSTLFKSATVAARETAHLVDHYDSAPPDDGETSAIYTQAVRGPTKLTEDSVTMTFTPASCYTGLMRKLVQAKYGSGSTRVFENVGVDYTYGGTNGVIYDSANDAYWLVRINASDATAYPMSFDADAKQLVADAQSQAEADALLYLMFSTATVSTAGEVALGGFTPAAGAPIAYGWKFSLTTNCADVVVANNPGYSYDRNTWTHMRLTFSFTAGVPSFIWQQLEQQDAWALSARSPIWTPYEGKTIWWNYASSSPDPTIDSDAPVYVTYDGDTLKLVRWKYTQGDTTTFSSTEWARIQAEQKQVESVFPVGTTYAYARYEVGKNYSYGFTDGVVDGVHSARTQLYEYEGNLTSTWYSWDTAGIPGPNLLNGSAPPQYPPTPYSYNFQNQHVGWVVRGRHSGQTDYNPTYYVNNGTSYFATTIDSQTNPAGGNHWGMYYRSTVLKSVVSVDKQGVTLGFITSLVIPESDACAYYIAKRVTESGNKTDGVTNTYERGFSKDIYLSNQGVILGEYGPALTGQVNQHMTGTTGFNWLGSAPGSTTATTAFSETDNTVVFQTANAQVSSFSPADSEIFHPNTITPYLTKMVTAISASADQSARFQAGTLTDSTIITSDEYPTDITTFVGAT